MVRQRLNS